MAVIPPASNASATERTCSEFCVRMMAMRPGLMSREMISARVKGFVFMSVVRGQAECSRSNARRLFNLFEFLSLGLGRVIFVQRVAAADQAVARGRRAITERTADRFPLQFTLCQRVRQDGRIRE